MVLINGGTPSKISTDDIKENSEKIDQKIDKNTKIIPNINIITNVTSPVNIGRDKKIKNNSDVETPYTPAINK